MYSASLTLRFMSWRSQSMTSTSSKSRAFCSKVTCSAAADSQILHFWRRTRRMLGVHAGCASSFSNVWLFTGATVEVEIMAGMRRFSVDRHAEVGPLSFENRQLPVFFNLDSELNCGILLVVVVQSCLQCVTLHHSAECHRRSGATVVDYRSWWRWHLRVPVNRRKRLNASKKFFRPTHHRNSSRRSRSPPLSSFWLSAWRTQRSSSA